MGIGDWGLGIGDWGLGIGPKATEIGDDYQGFEFFDTALQRASEFMSLRSGDLVILELEDICAVEVEQGQTKTVSYRDRQIEIIC